MSISNYFCLTIQLYYSRLTFLIKIMSPMYRITFFSHHFRSLLQPLGFLIFTLRIDFRLYSDTHSAVWKTDIWKYIPEITATVRPQLAFTRSPSISVTSCFRLPLGAWNEKVFLRTHPSVTTGLGGGHMGHDRSIQGFQPECLPGMMPLKGQQHVR